MSLHLWDVPRSVGGDHVKNSSMPHAYRSTTRARTRLTWVAAALVVLTLAAVHAGSARNALLTHSQRLLVLPFDLYDYSLDHRPQTVIPLHNWVAGLAGQVARDLPDGASIHQLGGVKALAALRKVRADYPHPTECRSCMVAIARRAGADIVVIGQVHKLSNLITYLDVEVDDVRTGQVLHVIHMRADGADTNVMWRHIARNLAGRVGQIVKHSR